MKISQYNWNWWFVITCIVLAMGISIGFCEIDKPNQQVHEFSKWCIIIGTISLLPCLYVGCKPTEHDN